LLDIVAIIGFSTILEPLWGLKEFLVSMQVYCLFGGYTKLIILALFPQIFSGIVGGVSLASGVLVAVLLYAVSQSYSFL
jgi:hypothetical protein